MSDRFVPIDAADPAGAELRVLYAKEFVKDAPRIDADGSLEHSQEDQLYAYHGNGSTGGAGTTVDYDARGGH